MALKKLKQEREEAMKKLNALKTQKEEEHIKIAGEMDREWHKFCTAFNLENWEKAQSLWQELDKDGAKPPLLEANTKELYEKSFTFSEVSKNDQTVEILDRLQIDEANLNANPTNKILLQKYVQAAQSARDTLKSTFGDFWKDPAAPVALAEEPLQGDDELMLQTSAKFLGNPERVSVLDPIAYQTLANSNKVAGDISVRRTTFY